LHWLLVAALIPLAFSLLEERDGKDDLAKRLADTLEQAPPETHQRVLGVVAANGTLDEVLAALPDQKLAGALLQRRTWLHWAFAGAAAMVFLTFFLVLAVHQRTNALHLLAIGLFTATVGIVFLFVVQTLAEWLQGMWISGRGIMVILFYIVKAIGFSYRAALDPENGFLLSFVGYTAGVGLCEEVCKALPLFWYYRRPTDQSWHTAFLWGLASGAGFGIAEGIMYASNYYNGIHGPGVYAVRFISCVALHALWTGSVAITLNQKQHLIQQPEAWYAFIPPVLYIVAIPMVLHGLYDTFLKKEMCAAALTIAVLSFVFLAFQISRLHAGAGERTVQKAFQS
jgi:RsiW-degrading membrane proteinase PrsW (M82 family)